MITKGKISLLKRITAFVLAILMVFTLMPLEDLTLAEETSTENCTFTVKDKDGNPIAGATITIYRPSEDYVGDPLGRDIALMTDGDGKTSISTEDMATLVEGKEYLYRAEISGETSSYVQGFFNKSQNFIDVVIEGNNYGIWTSVYVGESEDTVGSGIKVYLLKGNEIIDVQITDENGSVIFNSKMTSNETYTIVALTDDKIAREEVTVPENGLLVNKAELEDKENAPVSFKKEALFLDFDGNSTVTGTNPITGEPSDWLGKHQYTFSAESENSITVDDDGVVSATEIGTAIITAVLTSDEYAETTISYTVQVIAGATITGKVTDKEETDAIITGKAYLVGKDTVIDLKNFDPKQITILREADIVNGTYTFDPVEAGDYKVVIISDGYISKCVDITITDREVEGNNPVSNDIADFEKDIHDISGAIKDTEGNGIQGISAFLYKGEIENADELLPENLIQTVETDENGAYTFKDIVPNTYTIVISHEDYKNVFETVSVVDEDSPVDDIELVEKTVVKLDFVKDEIIIFKNGDWTLNNTLSIKDGENAVALDDWDIEYSVSPESIIELGNGLEISDVKGLGTATITVTASHDDYKIDPNSQLSFTVNVYEFMFENSELQDKYLQFKEDGNPIEMNKNDEYSSKAVVKDVNGDVVEFAINYELGTSEDVDVTIDTNGNVKVVGAPNETPTTIIASIADGENYKGISLSYDLKVVNKSLGDYVFDWDYTFENNDDKKVTFKYSDKHDETIKQIAVKPGYPSEVTINYEVISGNAVSVDENGVLTINGKGIATIQARMESTVYETKAPIEYTVEITAGEHDKFTWDVAFNPNDGQDANTLNVTYKDVLDIKTKGQYENAVVEYSVTSTNNAVSYNEVENKFEINCAGTATITARIPAGTNYAEKTLTCTVNVAQKPQNELTWNIDGNSIGEIVNRTYDDDPFVITIVGQNDSTELTHGFASSDTSVATVDADGKVTILKAGNTQITYTSSDAAGNYEAKTLSFELVVAQNPQANLNWNINGASIGATVNRTYGDAPFVITIVGQNDSDELVHGFSSSNTDVATVDANGKVTISKAGETTITYTSKDEAGNFVAKTLEFKLVVAKNPQSALKWNIEGFSNTGSTKTVTYGDAAFTIGITGQIVTNELVYGFTSSNTDVVTVDENGKVTIKHTGEAYIEYKSVDQTGNYITKELSYKVVVKKATPSLSWSNGYNNGQVTTFTYVPSKVISDVKLVGAKEGAKVTYSAQAENGKTVAEVNAETGVVTIKGVGKVTITATVAATENYNSASISYTYVVNPSKHTSFAWQNGNPGTVKLTYEDAIKHYVAVGASENAKVTYSSDNASVASVDPTTGVVTIKKAGKAKITATAAATNNYVVTEVSYNIEVAKKQQTMSFAQKTYTLVNGDNKFVSPVISTQNTPATADKIVYSVPKNNVVKINSATGELEFTLQPGTVTVTATKPTNDQYIGTEVTYTLTVKEWDPLKSGKAATYYTVTGTQKDPSTSWFTNYSKNNPIKLKATKDYSLYKSEKDPVLTTKWASAISVSNVHEGKDNAITFYIKDKVNGYVSKQYTVNNIKADSEVPNAAIAIDNVTLWEKFLSFFTFNLAGQKNPELKVTSSDETSGVKVVYYYISKSIEPLEKNGLIDVDALEKEAKWTTYKKAVDLGTKDVTNNVIYAKVVDKAGNIAYVATNGLIFDGKKPTVTPTIVTKAINGYYNKNVTIELDVVDAAPYSGIKEISYIVECAGEMTDSATLFEFKPKEKDNPQYSELVSNWNSDKKKKNIVVDASENNSDKVKVTFIVTDNAGNTTEKVVNLKIDDTNPVINVSYNNNNGDDTFTDGVYFNTDRVATITVLERHFNKDKFELSITNSDGVVPVLSEWTKTNGSGNGDDTAYTATVYFGADGDYTLGIDYTDEAGNKCNGVNYGASQAPTAFTIDKTVPVVEVSYDNNEAMNENYFKADRVGTITIHEHNFDPSRVNAIISATDNGTAVSAPSLSGWTSNGNVHTATVSYSADALYTFDIEYLDKAGNAIVDFVEQTFYVDKTTPQLSITEISDQSANNDETVGFTVTATDTNFDVFAPVLTAVIQTEDGIVTKELEVGSISEIANGRVYSVNNLDSDGIYSIKCTVVDKAGNAYTEVSLQRQDGSTYVENRAGEDTLITFSVNRQGSTFDIDNTTAKIIDNEYIKNVEDDIVIYEVNTDEVLSYVLTLNGTDLVEGTDYKVTSSGGDGTWMKYTYTVNKNLFSDEGEYVLVISSTDNAENNAFSDIKNTNISFIVDRTAPVVTVTGMESNRSYQTEAQTVTVMPTDDGGMVESLTINFVDKDGNVTEQLFSESGDTLRETLDTNGGVYTFTLKEVRNQNIQIICTDKAFDANGESNTFNQIYESITVSASGVTIFFADGTVYYILAGLGALVAIAIAAIFMKRRKGSNVKKS